jgi:hypothetical protein
MMSGMIFSGITRFTLFLLPRAALLMQTAGREIERSWVIPAHAPDFDDILLKALKRQPMLPLKIVVDAPALDFKTDILPPAAPYARGKLLARQCAHHFPSRMAEASSAIKNAKGEWQAVHAAIPQDFFVQKVFEKIARLPNPIEPLSFFAAEWPVYAAQLCVTPPQEWMVAHVLGEGLGLRQIILKDGQPVFTRHHGDCLPGLPRNVLAERLAAHIQSLHHYLPRLLREKAGDVPPRLYVPACLHDIGQEDVLQVLQTQVYPIAAPKGELVPPEWGADIAWLATAAGHKKPVMPFEPGWLRMQRTSMWKRQIALWVLLFFGSAGIYSGVNILSQPGIVTPPPPASAPQAHSENTPPPAEATPPVLRVDAIIYNGPEDWVVWINGEKHVPGGASGQLKVVDVSARHVTVRWQEADAREDIVLDIAPKGVGGN